MVHVALYYVECCDLPTPSRQASIGDAAGMASMVVGVVEDVTNAVLFSLVASAAVFVAAATGTLFFGDGGDCTPCLPSCASSCILSSHIVDT